MKTFNGKIVDEDNLYLDGKKAKVVSDDILECDGKYYTSGPKGLMEISTIVELDKEQEDLLEELENSYSLFDDPSNYDENKPIDIDEVIEKNFEKIARIKKSFASVFENVKSASLDSKKAAELKAGLFHKKGAIQGLQTATISITSALHALTINQKVILEYQKVLTDFCRYLLFLGTSNIANNRSIVASLEEKLSGASQRKLSPDEKNELLSVVKELKNQQTIYDQQEQLKMKVKELSLKVNELNDEILLLKTGEKPKEHFDYSSNEIIEAPVVKEKESSKKENTSAIMKLIIAFVVVSSVLITCVIALLYMHFNPITQ